MNRRTFLQTTFKTLSAALLFPRTSLGSPESAPDDWRFMVVGQSLIEHDARKYPYPDFKGVSDYLKLADIAMTHLEVPINTQKTDTKSDKGIYHHSAEPSVIDCLKEMSFDVLTLAGNHICDLGTQGMLTTMEHVDDLGFLRAGVGENLEAAAAPRYKTINGRCIALVAVASGALADNEIAKPDHPGVNHMTVRKNKIDPADSDRVLKSIRTASQNADFVIIYHHNHYWAENHWQQSPDWQKNWARQCVDAGASIFVGQGVPFVHGIEIYKNKPILYSLGNFIFHTHTKPGRWGKGAWESNIVDCYFEGDALKKIELIPLALNEGKLEDENFLATRGRPSFVTGKQAHLLLNRVKQMSKEYDTRIKIIGDRGLITLD